MIQNGRVIQTDQADQEDQVIQNGHVIQTDQVDQEAQVAQTQVTQVDQEALAAQVIPISHETLTVLLDLGNQAAQVVQVNPISRETLTVLLDLEALVVQVIPIFRVIPIVHEAPEAQVQSLYNELGYCTYKKVYIRNNKEYFISGDAMSRAWHPSSLVRTAS